MSKFRIHGFLFMISDPYKAGSQVLSPGDAKALNSLRSENIRNNMAKEFAKLKQPISPEDLESFRERVQEYDLSYKFYPSLREEVSPAGLLTREIEIIAQERATEAWKVGGPSFESLLDKFRIDPEVQSEAHKRLAVQDEVARKILMNVSS